jgi:hypothetical protein
MILVCVVAFPVQELLLAEVRGRGVRVRVSLTVLLANFVVWGALEWSALTLWC